MPLKQLKEISKVMNQIMGVDQQVKELKRNLEATSRELIKAVKS